MTTTANDQTSGPVTVPGPVPDDPKPVDVGIDIITDPDPEPAAARTEPAAAQAEPAAAQAEPAAADDADVKTTARDKVTAAAAAAGTAAATWWGFTSRPMSVAEAWRLSAIDARRVPADSPLLGWAWWMSNRTDRLLLFALLAVLPTCLNGPLLWCAPRPSRRLGLYLIVIILAFVVPSITGG